LGKVWEGEKLVDDEDLNIARSMYIEPKEFIYMPQLLRAFFGLMAAIS